MLSGEIDPEKGMMVLKQNAQALQMPELPKKRNIDPAVTNVDPNKPLPYIPIAPENDQPYAAPANVEFSSVTVNVEIPERRYAREQIESAIDDALNVFDEKIESGAPVDVRPDAPTAVVFSALSSLGFVKNPHAEQFVALSFDDKSEAFAPRGSIVPVLDESVLKAFKNLTESEKVAKLKAAIKEALAKADKNKNLRRRNSSGNGIDEEDDFYEGLAKRFVSHLNKYGSDSAVAARGKRADDFEFEMPQRGIASLEKVEQSASLKRNSWWGLSGALNGRLIVLLLIVALVLYMVRSSIRSKSHSGLPVVVSSKEKRGARPLNQDFKVPSNRRLNPWGGWWDE